MQGGRRSWPGQWGRDQIASSYPRHRCHWGQEPALLFNTSCPSLACPPPGLTVDGGQEAQLGLWGLNSPQKAPPAISSLGLAFSLVVLVSYLE